MVYFPKAARLVAGYLLLINIFVNNTPLLAEEHSTELSALKREIQELKDTYNSRLHDLEKKLSDASAKPSSNVETSQAASAQSKNNAFNPAISLILNGRLSEFSQSKAQEPNLRFGEEGGRANEGFSVDETELNATSNVDDLFKASMTVAAVPSDGSTELELEEVYFETTPGAGLPTGLNLKAGRSLWTFGTLNEHHAHTDNFADRPLPYRVFLNNAFNDDGVQASYILPTNTYVELGGGGFRGDDFPFGGSNKSVLGAYSAFARVGDDIGDNQEWRLGGYLLDGDVGSRSLSESDFVFSGRSRLFATDLRYSIAPTGNSRAQEIAFQGEYFWRRELGEYRALQTNDVEKRISGWNTGYYLEAVYKFAPAWRIGLRYSELNPLGNTPPPLLSSASQTRKPSDIAAMIDWSHSEFSRFRLQYNRADFDNRAPDHQVTLQYILSIGAHGAHVY